MSFIRKVKQARELGRQLKAVKKEMKEVEVNIKGLKAKGRKLKELVTKMRGVQNKMGEWELGQLAQEADKEGKKLDKLITLAEARERVVKARISVAEAKERLKPRRRETKIVSKGTSVKTVRKPMRITFSMPTIKTKSSKAPMPKRKPVRITPKRPALKR